MNTKQESSVKPHRKGLPSWLAILFYNLLGLFINLPVPSFIRLLPGLVFFFFFPGFYMLKMFRLKNPDFLTTSLLSIGLSLGLIALVGTILNYLLGLVDFLLLTVCCMLITTLVETSRLLRLHRSSAIAFSKTLSKESKHQNRGASIEDSEESENISGNAN